MSTAVITDWRSNLLSVVSKLSWTLFLAGSLWKKVINLIANIPGGSNMSSYRHIFRFFPGSVNINKNFWKFCGFVCFIFISVIQVSPFTQNWTVNCQHRVFQDFVFIFVSVNRNIIKFHYQYYDYMCVQVVFCSITSLHCLLWSGCVPEAPEIQCTWISGMLH